MTITNGGTAVFSVTASGTGPFTYQWRVNGTNISPIITTVAGTGTPGFSGDGGPATKAKLYCPSDVALDGAGNLFITDGLNHRIRKVDANGIVTTVAGNGISGHFGGYSGDGGPATNAAINTPVGVALDAAGRLFFADYANNRVRKVDADGTITTVAGGGTWDVGDGLPATDVRLGYPEGLVLDTAGNLIISTVSDNRLLKVDVNGIISTVAGNGTNGFSGDSGPATNAWLNWPTSVELDAAGNLFIADSYNNRIRKVDANGIITTVVGNGAAAYSGDGGPATNASLDHPIDVAVDAADNLFIADANNGRIRKVDANGNITTVAGSGTNGLSGDGGPAIDAMLKSPTGIALDRSGNLLITENGNHCIRKVTFATTPSLILNNAGPAKAGDYSVIITSPYGCITSSVATLSFSTVLPPREFAGVLTHGTNLALQFKDATPSYPYVLQTTTNLTPPVNWEALATNLTDADGVWRFGVTLTNTDSPARFFRVFGE